MVTIIIIEIVKHIRHLRFQDLGQKILYTDNNEKFEHRLNTKKVTVI